MASTPPFFLSFTVSHLAAPLRRFKIVFSNPKQTRCTRNFIFYTYVKYHGTKYKMGGERTKRVKGGKSREKQKEEVKYEFCHRYGVCHKCSG
jgi:hypothetical protein